MLSLFGQLIKFMRVYKKFWMAPVIFGLLALGGLLVAVQSTALSPFIYAIF